jgi:hypothetical protein
VDYRLKKIKRLVLDGRVKLTLKSELELDPYFFQKSTMNDEEFTVCPMCEGPLEQRRVLEHPKKGIIRDLPHHVCLNVVRSS